MLAGHPASVGTPSFLQLNVGSMALTMLEPFLKSDPALAADFSKAKALYQEAILEPSPFIDNGVIGMPVMSYYDSFMKPGAVPIQYVKVNPDFNIHQLYVNVSLACNSSCWTILYPEMFAHFSCT